MNRVALYAGAAMVGGLVLYVIAKKRPGESIAGAVGRTAAGAVGSVTVGGVKGLGDLVGIPDTNMTQCQKDVQAGRMWDASFSCPASTFVKAVFNSTTASESVQNDARQIDRIMEREERGRGDLNLGGVYDDATSYQTEQYDAMGNRIF